MSEQEIKIKCLELAIQTIAALPDAKCIVLLADLKKRDDLEPDEAILDIAIRFEKYLRSSSKQQ